MTIESGRAGSLPFAALLGALHFAADRHRDKKRKDEGASPYINHPIAVAEVLARIGGVTELAVLQAAILHDTIEDTKTTREELAECFGERVAGIVEEVTDDKKLSKGDRKTLQVVHAPRLSHAAKLVKLGDKIANVRDVWETPPSDWSTERRAGYVEWARRVVDGCRGTNAALERHFDELAERASAAIRAAG
jgi:guanosine-3',5'-bis(diphosphate) 3'-pyrophosphohydrolase